MARKKIPLALPFRYIRRSDAKKRFYNPLSEINHVSLADLISRNRRYEYVVVYDATPDILGFIFFRDTGTHFYIVLVERNELVSYPELRPGTQLIQMVERISPNYDYKKVVVDSMDETISYYERLEYKKTGKIIDDPQYGMLTRMEKSLI